MSLYNSSLGVGTNKILTWIFALILFGVIVFVLRNLASKF